VPDHDRWYPVSEDLLEALDIPENNSVRIETFQAARGIFESTWLPVKGPRSMMTGVFGNASQQAAAGRA
jgi:hypothetical protein